MTDPERLSFEQALFRANDMIGHRVQVRINDLDSQLLRMKGVLQHDTTEGLWGAYTVDGAQLNLHTFQSYDRHVQSWHVVTFMYDDGSLRVELQDLDVIEARRAAREAS